MPQHLTISHRSLIVIISIIIVIAVFGFSYLNLAQATITITPTTETKSTSQQIIISSNVKDPDFVNYRLPARIIEKEIYDKKTVTREADATFDDFAKGKVVLHNKQNEEQQLLPKTHLRHEDSKEVFLTDTGISIPPQGKIGITVTAKEKGPAGNVPPGKWIVEKLPPYLKDKVYGESNQPFSGGVAVKKPLSEDEISNAQEQLVTDMEKRLKGHLTAQAKGAYLPANLLNFETEELTSSAMPGSKTSQFEVAAKVIGQAFLVDENDLLGLTLLKLRSAAIPEQEFVKYNPQSFDTTMIKRDLDREEAIIEGTLSGLFVTKVAPTILTGKNLAGLTDDEIKNKLSDLPGVNDVQVKFSPFWVTSAPGQKNAIQIKISNPDE